MSKLVVIEGACDGIGKTTQVEMLKDHLIKDNINVISHHFPTYDSDAGKLIKNYLNGDYGMVKDLSPYFINSLYAIDRKIICDELVKEKNNSIILVDRYTTSSLIYQSALIETQEEKKKFIDYVIDFEYNKLKIFRPDEIIFLTASFDVITKIRKMRKNNDGVANDIHEKDIDFMKKVYDNANFVSEYLKWKIVNCSNNDGMRNKEEIHNDVYKLIKRK